MVGVPDVFVFGAAGPARRLTQAPAAISPAGFAPAYENGPFWALSSDGSRAAWVADVAGSSELFTAAVPTNVPSAPTHVSQDAVFDPFLEEVGVLGIFQGRLLALFGDRSADPFSITAGDVYEIDLGANGSFTARNVTGTSGDAVAPFTAYGMIEPRGVWWLPGPSRLLIADTYATATLRGVNPVTGGVVNLCYPCLPPERVEHVAGHVVLVEGVDYATANTTRLLSVPDHLGVAAQELATLPAEDEAIRLVAAPDGRVSFVDAELDDVGSLIRIDAATGAVEMLQATPTIWGPTLAVSPTGETLASQGDEDSAAQFLTWPPTAPGSPVFAATSPGFVLPGN